VRVILHGFLAVSYARLLNVAAIGDTFELRPAGPWTATNANLLEAKRK
jgi:hypothetical protein